MRVRRVIGVGSTMVAFLCVRIEVVSTRGNGEFVDKFMHGIYFQEVEVGLSFVSLCRCGTCSFLVIVAMFVVVYRQNRFW